MRGATTANEPLSASPSDQNHHQQEKGEESDGGNLLSRTWSESKKIWLIAGPSIFCRLAMFSLIVITQAFAGHLGDRDLAAISIATTVIISISFGFLVMDSAVLELNFVVATFCICGTDIKVNWTICGGGRIIRSGGNVFTLIRFLQCQLKTAVVAWVSGGALALHVFVSWLFFYRLRVGIIGTALTLDFSWWVSVLGLFLYTVCGGCPHSWNGVSVQAFVGLWEFFKLSVASGVMLSLENFYYRVLIIVSGTVKNTEVPG
ncbi:hypothetical protein RJ639_044418 [Escallonia herrerae]|uniref:Uncharacterized protein n=1 Tax=Escallonia herrerae TaxID=1293975 RepID=A0AA89B321_9ASTE|nr:hypothetical protein RJ639_044418 [Escallonia herrerae]